MSAMKWLICAGLLGALATACGSDGKSSTPGGDGGGGDSGVQGTQQTLCAKYGGADNIEKVIKQDVIGTIAADCRINTFFTSLSKDSFTRVQDCLSIQAQELFSCPDVHFAGSKASNGLPCRDMTTAHKGLGISSGDFDALIEDVASGLTQAGVSQDDIGKAAPALVGLKDQIVEKASDKEPTKPGTDCDAGTGG